MCMCFAGDQMCMQTLVSFVLVISTTNNLTNMWIIISILHWWKWLGCCSNRTKLEPCFGITYLGFDRLNVRLLLWRISYCEGENGCSIIMRRLITPRASRPVSTAATREKTWLEQEVAACSLLPNQQCVYYLHYLHSCSLLQPKHPLSLVAIYLLIWFCWKSPSLLWANKIPLKCSLCSLQLGLITQVYEQTW